MSIPSLASTFMIYRIQLDKELISFGNIATIIESTGGDFSQSA